MGVAGVIEPRPWKLAFLSLSLRVCGWVGGFHAARLLLVNVKSRMYRAGKCSELVGKLVLSRFKRRGEGESENDEIIYSGRF